ncbi:helix-turn-helix transcriptional regulator [Phenylobacterium sp. J367]|uniref:ArsR/SmtB family transcription factor n=1 Tax=Phenylobacterium sp. J367 TaxID=2898435 RepID=UPI002151F184|nr:helix-turn-helix domain-containing protein [Phenylobacterium sp. J367]MCR5878583.1 helix-turn-helix domain-containing protein [Phenylobacterium sp. J367]
MRLGPDITRIAALLGEPARANMLAALLGGEALTAGELAREAGITAQTASGHLAKLEAGGLLVRRRQGRHSYFALAGEDVAEAMEQLVGLADRAGHQRTQPGPKDPALRKARVCYDHLAGDAGVAMLDALIAQGRIADHDGALALTDQGRGFAREFGVALDDRGRRPLCKACLDWSVRRSHLAGVMGAGLLQRIYALGWARRIEGTRVVQFSAPGLVSFERTFARIP